MRCLSPKIPLRSQLQNVLQYNAWRKRTTKKSIQEAIATTQQLRQEVALDKTSIRKMLKEGRIF
ncbi:hypothetical protein H6G97_12545 [Nostoc flagelliforme FACHB-838]|uniref:Uncharacterized protein n=1 Tax=Nostoc flagelliforme FACHB-838 TaxID=2692904 RepID=A0ABR8DLM0_9NOSO|nr:hypothetical protein [Nostoc flagelliforme FACHB-838]